TPFAVRHAARPNSTRTPPRAMRPSAARTPTRSRLAEGAWGRDSLQTRVEMRMLRTGVFLVALGATIAAEANAAQGHPPIARARGGNPPARAEAPVAPPPAPSFVLPEAPPAPVAGPSRFHVLGQKYASPQTRMSQAGVAWSINTRVSLQLSYERTAYAPLM